MTGLDLARELVVREIVVYDGFALAPSLRSPRDERGLQWIRNLEGYKPDVIPNLFDSATIGVLLDMLKDRAGAVSITMYPRGRVVINLSDDRWRDGASLGEAVASALLEVCDE